MLWNKRGRVLFDLSLCVCVCVCVCVCEGDVYQQSEPAHGTLNKPSGFPKHYDNPCAQIEHALVLQVEQSREL